MLRNLDRPGLILLISEVKKKDNMRRNFKDPTNENSVMFKNLEALQ